MENFMDKLKLPKSIPSWSVGLLAGAAAAAAGGIGGYQLAKQAKKKKEAAATPEAIAAAETGATILPGSEPEPAEVEEPATMNDVVADVESFIQENCPYLELQSDPDTRYYITQSVNIGRYEHNDIQLADNTMGVSRLHCRIFIKGGKYYVVDLGASLRSTVDGAEVNNAKPSSADAHEFYDYELKDGSVLTVGKYVFTFRQPAPAAETSAPAFADCDSTVVIG